MRRRFRPLAQGVKNPSLTSNLNMGRGGGFEPPTPSTSWKCSATEFKKAPNPANDHFHARLEQWAEDYLLELRAKKSPKTAEQALFLLKPFLTFTKNEQELTRPVWLRYITHLRETERSEWTARTKAAVASRFLRWCASEGLMPPIVKEGDLPKPPEPNPKPLNLSQLQRLLALCAERGDWMARRDYALVATLIDTGLRRAELLQLQVRDVLAGVAVVRQKGNRYLRVYLSEATCLAIRAYLRAYTRETGAKLEPDDLLWRSKDGRPLSPNGVRQLFRRLSEQYGERVYAHRVRSTSITLRLATGASTELVREAVGHSDERSLRHYAKLAEADKARLIRESSPANLLLQGRKRH